MSIQHYKKLLLALPFISTAYAIELPPGQQNKQELDRLERQNNQALIEDAKRTEQRLQQQRTISQGEQPAKEEDSSSWKFKIDKIVILDDDLFEDAPQRVAIIERYQGKELGKADIFNLVRELTNFYIARGYVTTLVGIEPGNLKEGTLTLRVLWGKIDTLKANGKEPGFRQRTRLFTAYPFAKGNVLNMQDIDQAVENLMRVSGRDNIQLIPSVVNASSDLNLITQPVFPLSLATGLNNSGSKSSGWQQYYGSATLKDIAGLNDIFNAYYSWNNLNNSEDSQDSLSLSYSIPLGYWGVDLSYYKSSYDKMIGGYYGGYDSDGHSERSSIRVSRMLTRNASGKTSMWAKFEKRQNYNGIEGDQIDVSSKTYSSLSSGITWVGALLGGWFYGDVGASFGTPWSNATWKNDKDLDGFDVNYIRYNGIASWSRPLFQFGRLGINYELNTGFQYTNNTLVSDYKMTLGDEYSVRGFKDDSLMVDSGAWIANTLNFPFDINIAGIYQLTPYLGYDLGFAKDNCPEGVNACDSQFMMGAGVGVKASGRFFSSSVAAGWPVKKPDSMDKNTVDNTVVYYKLEVNF
ncbi:hemolysin activation protein [Klebsiella sp. RIT-PI-d]|uniref:ShlB/FhaC/HecB family hemolysin secretion/activation protein n=1 Tax=Klebsiella sp. RIT-PI-d TaxID=1681196 RepID=UPI0006760235|nr:ShlB/FhaC/HecB family hemolysin secretion/activation protein [Klebsiella sp. RIT-PI-d]KNC12043.1 hemolysin activation protein [Klebsiella sp. RIT-PI-d]